MNYAIVYDLHDVEGPSAAIGWMAIVFYVLALLVLFLCLHRLRKADGWEERVAAVMGLIFGVLFPAFLGHTIRASVAESQNGHRRAIEALETGRHQTVEGVASLRCLDGRYSRGKLLYYDVRAEIGGARFRTNVRPDETPVTFYHVPIDGTPYLRVSYLEGGEYSKVLKVEVAH